MAYILATSSVNHAIDALSPKQQSMQKDKTYSVSSLNFNPYSKKLSKIAQNLFSKDLKDKTEIVLWHDVLKNCISR